MTLPCAIRLLEQRDTQLIAAAFAQLGWDKPLAQYERYLWEQKNNQRLVLVAFLPKSETFAGYITICWKSHYPPFRKQNIPEIVDFNVLPSFRRQGIGAALMDEAEARIAAISPIAGIGVGLTSDYGSAQRMYVKRGYIPTGQGLIWQNKPVTYGQTIPVDDDLALYFTKSLRPIP